MQCSGWHFHCRNEWVILNRTSAQIRLLVFNEIRAELLNMWLNFFFFSYACHHHPKLVSHETASSSAECGRDKPPFSFVRGQDSTMWDSAGARVLEQGQFSGDTWRARGARAYNGVLVAEPPAGSRGKAPGQEAKPPWSWKLFSSRTCNGQSKFVLFAVGLFSAIHHNIDFSKAYDLFDHPILLGKLASLGLPDRAINWIISYLTPWAYPGC